MGVRRVDSRRDPTAPAWRRQAGRAAALSS